MTEIFVFGSNLAGRHGKGAALFAKENHGAIYGKGWGRQGNSYAIPTKDENLVPLFLTEIKDYVKVFLQYAKDHPELTFNVTAIGCGLAGFIPEEIAPFFNDAPDNVRLPKEFQEVIGGA
jgi:hypothetical protein